VHPIDQAFEQSGGFLRRRDLLRLGLTDHDIRSHRRQGSLRRVRQGWYLNTRSGCSDAAVRAVRVGGWLSGFAALESYGVWVPRGYPVEVVVPRHARRLRSPGDAARLLDEAGTEAPRIRWTAEPVDITRQVWRLTPVEALAGAFRVATREDAVIVADSALHLKLVTSNEVDAVADRLPRERRHWTDLVDGRAESGGETAVRLRLMERGIDFEPQVVVPGVGRLDGKIGPRTFVEIDGFSVHGDRDSFERDHERGLASVLWNHRVVRMTSRQVFEEWPLCLAAVQAALAVE
jgi:hypothetical protein